MVGTVVFKNFETGSYKNIRLIAYSGTGFAHIGEGEFFSCLVNVDRKSIVYEDSLPQEGPERVMSRVLFVAQKAREYLYQNPYVTIAEYALNGDECKFRTVSVKCGVYQIPDFANLFFDSAFYKLISQKPDKSFLWCSTLCELMNFAFQKTFSTSLWVYSHSGYGIYFNISCLPARILKKMNLPIKTVLDILGKSSHRVKLKGPGKSVNLPEYKPVLHPYRKLITLASQTKLKAAQRLQSLIKDKKGACKVWQVASNFADDEYIVGVTDALVQEMSDYAANYAQWGYLDAMSHKDCLTFREVFAISSDAELIKTISQAAFARSVNHKFLKKLPCSEFFDGDGSVINIKKEK